MSRVHPPEAARGEERPWHKRFYNRWWQVSPDDSIKLELMDEGHLLWEFWLGDGGDSLMGRARLRSHGRGMLTRALIVAYPRECIPPEITIRWLIGSAVATPPR